MTVEELKKIPFHFVAHINMADVHITTYASEDNKLGFTVYQPMEDDAPVGRMKREFRIGDQIYKSYKKFIEALKDYDTAELQN